MDAHREESKNGEAVVLVHGLWMTGREMRVLGGRLEESGFRVRYFRYRSWRGGLAQAAGTLREFAEATEGELERQEAYSAARCTSPRCASSPRSWSVM